LWDMERYLRPIETADAAEWWFRHPTTTNRTWARGVQGTSSADYEWVYNYDLGSFAGALRDDLWTSTEKYIRNIVTSDKDTEIAVADVDILEDILRG